ncbi:MAG: aromatic amino acid transaminase [Pseudomonadales bacterium]
MFEHLDQLPADPILGLGQQFQADPNPNKVGLSVGVFQDASGNTPILASVKKAEAAILAAQQSKAYIPQAGDAAFLQGITELVLGSELAQSSADRVAAVQAAGGCGALRIAAEVAYAANPAARIWVSTPTWANHFPLLQSSGLELLSYPYYDETTSEIEFEAMCTALGHARAGDLVLLHASCHNPTGADLRSEQWDRLIELMAKQRLVPFIDSAYQGFAVGLEEDAYGIRAAVERLPNVLVASSCSKNFGLYRERTGVMLFAGQNSEQAQAARSHALALARCSYTMAPYHGGGIVGQILGDPTLTAMWREEVASMREHIQKMRVALSEALAQHQCPKDFSFIGRQRGMFSLLGIDREAIARLRAEYGIYVLDSGRMNAAGLSAANIPVVAEAIATVIR